LTAKPDDNKAMGEKKIKDCVFNKDIKKLASSNLWEKLSDQTMLVTGAAGMLGSHLALAADTANKNNNYGIKIIVLYRDIEKAKKLYKNADCEMISHDLIKPLEIKKPIDYIFHTAGPVGPAVFKNNPIDVLKTNTSGIFSVLECAVNNACKGIVFASTHEVYGNTQGEQFENTDFGPVNSMESRSCYILAKQTAENALACYYKQHDLPTFSARLSRLYGPEMNINSGLFICDFINDAIKNNFIHIKGALNLLRPLCYITDAAEAMLRILLLGNPGEAYNIQGDELPTIAEIADIIAKQTNCDIKADYPETRTQPLQGHWLNTSKLKETGWQQNTSLHEGLKKTLTYYTATGK